MARLIPIQQISPNPEDKRQRFRPRPQPRERASERAARIAGIVTSGLGAAANVASTVGGLVDKFGPTDAEKLDEARRKLAVQSRMSPMGVGESEALGFEVGAAKRKGDFAGGETSGLLGDIVRTRRADPDRLEPVMPEVAEPEVAEPVPLEISASDARSIRRAATIGNRAAKRVQRMLDDETIRVSEAAEDIQVEFQPDLAKELEKRLEERPAAPQTAQPTGPARLLSLPRDEVAAIDSSIPSQEDREFFRQSFALLKPLDTAGLEAKLKQYESGIPEGFTQELKDKQSAANQALLTDRATQQAEQLRKIIGRRKSLRTAAEIVASGQEFTTSQLNELYRGFVEAGDRQEAERLAALAPRALDFSRFMATPGEPEVLTRAKALDAVRAQADDGRGKGGAEAALKLMADRSRKRGKDKKGPPPPPKDGVLKIEGLTYNDISRDEKVFYAYQLNTTNRDRIVEEVKKKRRAYKNDAKGYTKNLETLMARVDRRNALSDSKLRELGLEPTPDPKGDKERREQTEELAKTLNTIAGTAFLGSPGDPTVENAQALIDKIDRLVTERGGEVVLSTAGEAAFLNKYRTKQTFADLRLKVANEEQDEFGALEEGRNRYIGLLQGARTLAENFKGRLGRQ